MNSLEQFFVSALPSQTQQIKLEKKLDVYFFKNEKDFSQQLHAISGEYTLKNFALPQGRRKFNKIQDWCPSWIIGAFLQGIVDLPLLKNLLVCRRKSPLWCKALELEILCQKIMFYPKTELCFVVKLNSIGGVKWNYFIKTNHLSPPLTVTKAKDSGYQAVTVSFPNFLG